MARFTKEMAWILAIAVLLFASACQRSAEAEPETARDVPPPAPKLEPQVPATPEFPNLQKEILDDRFKTTSSPLGTFDFKNFTYPLPHGWQNPDGTDLTLMDGRRVPVSKFINDDMEDDEKAEARAMRRIGMSYVTT